MHHGHFPTHWLTARASARLLKTGMNVVAGRVEGRDNGGMNWLKLIVGVVRGLFVGRAALAAENLALRQQLAILHHEKPRPKLCDRDRRFWVWMAKWFVGWKDWLIVVQPETVVRWHREGFRRYWRWKSGGKPGRPSVPREVIALIKRMAKENPTWGAPRIQAELHLVGHDVAESTVAKYMPRIRKPPSQTWKTFLKNHVGCLASMDFLVVPTATFRLLYVFVVLCHERRRIVHFNVTDSPNSQWVAQQLREAFPFDTAPRYLIRDRDGCYGHEVRRCIEGMDTEEVVTAPHSPWQNPYVERLNGTLRRELLDHVIVLNERHLMRMLKSFAAYYHDARPHMSLDHNAPNPREVEGPEKGKVIGVPMVGGLHYRYCRRVA